MLFRDLDFPFGHVAARQDAQRRTRRRLRRLRPPADGNADARLLRARVELNFELHIARDDHLDRIVAALCEERSLPQPIDDGLKVIRGLVRGRRGLEHQLLFLSLFVGHACDLSWELAGKPASPLTRFYTTPPRAHRRLLTMSRRYAVAILTRFGARPRRLLRTPEVMVRDKAAQHSPRSAMVRRR